MKALDAFNATIAMVAAVLAIKTTGLESLISLILGALNLFFSLWSRENKNDQP